MPGRLALERVRPARLVLPAERPKPIRHWFLAAAGPIIRASLAASIYELQQGISIMAIGFGIIGCGMIANFHSKAIGDIRGAKVVACYDSFPQAAERLAASVGCKAYHELDEMLADPKVDVVTIGTPSGAHMEPAVAAAKAGKHVIVEKPLEVTLTRCDKIIDACAKAGVKLSAIFPSRFHDSSIELKRAIDGGRFGKLTIGDAYVKWFRSQAYYDSGAWRGTWELDGGGALMNQAIHSVDLLTWLMGPVVEIRARRLRSRTSGSPSKTPQWRRCGLLAARSA